MTVIVERVHSATPEVASLVTALDAVLAAEYPPDQRHGLALDALFQAHMRFFVARMEGQAVGCCGLATFDSYAEVKRMFVSGMARGRSVAQALLTRIEAEAGQAGYAVLHLETGLRQVAALRLYERAGFQRCEVFGSYAGMPARVLETSVFMRKRLEG